MIDHLDKEVRRMVREIDLASGIAACAGAMLSDLVSDYYQLEEIVTSKDGHHKRRKLRGALETLRRAVETLNAKKDRMDQLGWDRYVEWCEDNGAVPVPRDAACSWGGRQMRILPPSKRMDR